MIAFEVFINGHRICLAGVGNDGVLNAIVNWLGRPNSKEKIRLHVAGSDWITDESLRWIVPSIGVGAEILVKVVEANSADLPDELRSLFVCLGLLLTRQPLLFKPLLP
jgi:hypothetical protein